MTNSIFGFFGLRENPFKINPDPRFIFLTQKAQASLDELSYGVRARKGLILLTGEVGTGKTMLLRSLLDALNEQKMPTALVFNSHINPDHLLDFILNDFGISCASAVKSDKLLSLNTWLLERYRQGQIPVLVVDEAQGLSAQALEEIRLLLNFETPRDKLLQIVLAGQPELEENLKRHELRQLRQRITIRCRTSPLTLEQTHGYIRERLRIAGSIETIFEPEAITSLFAYSQGIPRLINVLCEHSLVNSCAEGVRFVSPRAVEQAVHDCQLDRAESVARVLKSGSYTRTGLNGADSILAAVSGDSDRLQHLPATSPLSSRRLAERAANVSIPPQPSVRQPSAAMVAASPHSAELSKSESELPPSERSNRVAQGKDPSQEQFAPQHQKLSSAALLRISRNWLTSFLWHTRVSSRQARNLIQPATRRYWKLMTHHASNAWRRLQSFAARTLFDPRWHKLLNRYAFKMRVALSRRPALKSPGPPPNTFARSRHAFRTKRQRSLSSLRHWLRQPISGNRKASAGSSHPRRSTPQ